jgi:hypothetical protein
LLTEAVRYPAFGGSEMVVPDRVVRTPIIDA